MAKLSLKHIYKVYPNGTKAVNDFNMDIKDKEFIVFVGPSGCGKSTTLRMIAGLEDITYGELTIGDEVVNSLEPKDRDIAMVFQNYALYPHMSIYENIAFGLRTRKVPKEVIDKKVKEVAHTLGIEDYLNKKPKEMSGGQRQRVALGRAIVREPKVMLLDEPLSNLDAKLRTQMRSEIVNLHKRLNTTFIYVTHDQVEAMTMGTRIVVMKDGYVKQIDSPKNLYRYPNNKFVASFIGSPQMNFYRVILHKEDDKVKIEFLDVENTIEIPFEKLIKIEPSYLDGKKEVILGIRAENIVLKKSNNSIKMRVSHIEELGNETLIYGDIDLNNDSIRDNNKTRTIVKVSGFKEIESNSIIDITLDSSFIHLFDSETEESILKRIPHNNYVNVEINQNKLQLYGLEFDLPPALCHLKDGNYDALIPLEAIKLSKGDMARIKNLEVIEENTNLLTLDINNHILFAFDNTNISGQVKLELDMSLITLLKNKEVIVNPVKNQNVFNGEFIVKKVKEKGMKSHNEYFLKFLNNEFVSTSSITRKMCQAYDNRRVFHEKYEFSFDSSSITVSKEGIEGKVINILDYGMKRYAIIRIYDEEIIILNNEVTVDDKVHLSFNIDNVSVIETGRSIKVI